MEPQVSTSESTSTESAVYIEENAILDESLWQKTLNFAKDISARNSGAYINPQLLDEERVLQLREHRLVPDAEYKEGYLFHRLAFVPIAIGEYIDIRDLPQRFRVCFGENQHAVFPVGIHCAPKYFRTLKEIDEKYKLCSFKRIELQKN